MTNAALASINSRTSAPRILAWAQQPHSKRHFPHPCPPYNCARTLGTSTTAPARTRARSAGAKPSISFSFSHSSSRVLERQWPSARRLQSTDTRTGTSSKDTNPPSFPPDDRGHDGSKTRTAQQPAAGLEPPVFDFASLGIRGRVKVVVIVVLCVFSTVETVFWVKVGWRWWKGEGQGNEVESEEVGRA